MLGFGGVRSSWATARFVFVTLALLLCINNCFLHVHGWRQWNYETYWAYDDGVAGYPASSDIAAWTDIWGTSPPPGAINGANYSAPRPRTGHSMVIAKWNGASYILMFGGRDNNRNVSHIPRTYNVKRVR
jgi:hypothetical protein